jgi:hypothetical protein
MDTSTLASALDNLEKSSSSLDGWLNFWTILVVVGVAVELVVLLSEYTHDWSEFKRGTIHSPERPSVLIFGLGFLGAGMVAIGVAGEFRVHVKAGKIESDMRSASRELVALADREAKDAGDRAAKADLARVQLEASMMWRHLSKKQAEAFCSSIPKNLVNKAVVTSSSQDSESWRYAVEFNDALRRCTVSAGLEPSGGVGNSFWGADVVFGVRVRFRAHFTIDDPRSEDVESNPAKRKALAISISKALEASGIKVAGVSEDGRGVIDLYVGPRVPPGGEPVVNGPASKDTPTMPAERPLGMLALAD